MATTPREPPRSRGAATVAALQPFDVSMSSRADGRDVITVRRTVIDLPGAESISVVSQADLRGMLKRRRDVLAANKTTRSHHIIRPLHEDGDEVTWERPGLVMWLLRMGLHAEGHRGTVVIGYLGLSILTGLDETRLRGDAVTRDVRIREHGAPVGGDLPVSVLDVDMGGRVMPLFDRRRAIRWAVWKEWLAPDVDVDQTLRLAAIRG